MQIAICTNAIGVQTQVGAAAVTNTDNIFLDASHDGVINSAEVEQETEQENECELAVCANAIGVQTQIGAAAVANTAKFYDDGVNSAEVEQETEQGNECANLQYVLTLLVVQTTNWCCAVTNTGTDPG